MSDGQTFWKGLRGFVGRRVPAQDADDVAQEVMVRIQRGIASLRDSDRVESWVYQVARRAIADYHRSRGRRLGVESGGDVEDSPGTDGPDGGFATFRGTHSVHEEVLSWMRPFAEGLPAGYREALLMADFDGRPQRDVADALGLTLSGAKSRIQRARVMLGEQLSACCELHFDSDGRVVDFHRKQRRDCRGRRD